MKTSEYLSNYGIQWLGTFTATATGVVFALIIGFVFLRLYVRNEIDSIKSQVVNPTIRDAGSTRTQSTEKRTTIFGKDHKFKSLED